MKKITGREFAKKFFPKGFPELEEQWLECLDELAESLQKDAETAQVALNKIAGLSSGSSERHIDDYGEIARKALKEMELSDD